MIVWVWDATGPGDPGGICGELARARRTVSQVLKDGGATLATVEEARVVLGGEELQTQYQRTGYGWTARRGKNGAVRWRPLAPEVKNDDPSRVETGR